MLIEEDRIKIAEQKVLARCAAMYPKADFLVTGKVPLDPLQAWPRQDDPTNGVIDSVPTPNEMWRVFVDINLGELSGSASADVACWYENTKNIGIKGLFTEVERISVEMLEITHPWKLDKQF